MPSVLPRATTLAIVLIGWSSFPAASAAAQEPAPEALLPTALPTPAFVANHGQWPRDAAFRIQGSGATASLTDAGLRFDLVQTETSEPPAGDGAGLPCQTVRASASVGLLFVDASPVEPRGEERRPGLAHFFAGSDPSAWRTQVPMHGAVRWHEPWPGIDVRTQSHPDGLLEFLLEVAVGVDPRCAVLRWEGVDGFEVLPDGALLLHTAAGAIRQSAPVAWQPGPGGKHIPVPVVVERLDGTSFRFRAEPPRADLPLVIDPVLVYHGGTGDDAATGVGRAPSGQILACGSTTSPPSGGGRDVFVSCFDFALPPASQLVWTTTLSGTLDDRAFDVDVDAAGFVTVVGGTMSNNFPVTPGSVQSTFGGGLLDGFVTQLTPAGVLAPGVSHSTYYGGADSDWCCRVETDAALQATVVGFSESPGLPAVSAVQPVFAGSRDFIVLRLAPFGSAIVVATYLGTSGYEGFPAMPVNAATQFTLDLRELGLDVDAGGRVLIAGRTSSGSYPTVNAMQGPLTLPDAVVTILDPSLPPASQCVYSTYLNGSRSDGATAARFGPGSTVVVAGYTYSALFTSAAAPPGAFQPAFVGPSNYNDGFVVFLDTSLSGPAQRTYLTYLGGQGPTPTSLHFDACYGLTVDGRGHATVCGFVCGQTPWPSHLGPAQPVHGGQRDGFVLRLRPAGGGASDVTSATFVGGSANDVLVDLDPEPAGGAAIAGWTFSTTMSPWGGALAGPSDALVGTMDLLHTQVARGGCDSAYCAGAANSTTVLLEVDRQPAAGLPFDLLVGEVPPQSLGVIGFGTGQTSPVPLPGGWVCISSPAIVLTLVSGTTGTTSLTLGVPAGFSSPIGLHAQVIWLPPACALPFTSSATLSF